MNSITMAIFGGVLNFNKMDWMARKTVRQLWRKFEEAEFEKKDRIYGTRDWDDPKLDQRAHPKSLYLISC